MSDSIADQFIITMAAIRELEQFTGNHEPMRHEVRELKQNAEQVLDDAIRCAWRIATSAKRVPKEAKIAADEAVKTATAKATP